MHTGPHKQGSIFVCSRADVLENISNWNVVEGVRVCGCLFGARTRPARFSKLVPLNKSRASFCSRECCLCVPEHVQVFRSRRSLGKRFSGAVVLCDIGPFQQSKVSALFSRVKHIRRWRTVSVRRKTNVSSVDCNS